MILIVSNHKYKLRGLSLHVNYTNKATAAWRIPYTVGFLDQRCYYFFQVVPQV
jgi:hypothetical protein